MATMRGALLAPTLDDLSSALESIHLWHLNVHQDHVVRLTPDALDRLETVAGHVGEMAPGLEGGFRKTSKD
jgi:hypothetical protein